MERIDDEEQLRALTPRAKWLMNWVQEQHEQLLLKYPKNCELKAQFGNQDEWDIVLPGKGHATKKTMSALMQERLALLVGRPLREVLEVRATVTNKFPEPGLLGWEFRDMTTGERVQSWNHLERLVWLGEEIATPFTGGSSNAIGPR